MTQELKSPPALVMPPRTVALLVPIECFKHKVDELVIVSRLKAKHRLELEQITSGTARLLAQIRLLCRWIDDEGKEQRLDDRALGDLDDADLFRLNDELAPFGAGGLETGSSESPTSA